MKHLVVSSLILMFVQSASATLVISEWMYNGLGDGDVGEYVEFTNIGTEPIDMTGWSFDDNSRNAGTIDLSAFGAVAPGQSVVLTDDAASAFAANWGIPTVTIIGGNTANLGRSDEINLFDAGDNLIARLTYGDQTFAGTVRTQYVSCNVPAADFGVSTVQTSWVLASAGDAYGSWQSARGEVGSPGRVPEPTGLTLLLSAALFVATRRR